MTTPVNYVCLKKFSIKGFIIWRVITTPVIYVCLVDISIIWYPIRKAIPVSCNSSCFDNKNRNWASWPSVGTSSLQDRPIPLDSSRKLTNSSLRPQATCLNVDVFKRPREKKPAKVLENHFLISGTIIAGLI